MEFVPFFRFQEPSTSWTIQFLTSKSLTISVYFILKIDSPQPMSKEVETTTPTFEAPINARLEGEKLLYDAMKHLTTLSSGTIVIFVTLYEKLYGSNSTFRELVIVSLLCFAASILVSFSLMLQTSNQVKNAPYKPTERHLSIRRKSHYVALGTFFLGMLTLILFALIGKPLTTQ